jgi:hypothetical protein
MSLHRYVASIAGLALGALALLAPGAVAAPALYVGDTADYATAFKVEEGRLYVIEFAGTTHCFFTEPFKDLGTAGFNSFAAPVLMRASGSEGLVASDDGAFFAGRGEARVEAELGLDGVSGTYSFNESELSYHCSIGSPFGAEASFEAKPYEPIGTPGAVAPSALERPAYYGSEGGVEIFLRAGPGGPYGIRGTFAPACRVERSKAIPSRHALFELPVSTERGADGTFRRRVKTSGLTHAGVPYTEASMIAGQITEAALTGTYRRVRTVKPRRRAPQTCVTGPLPLSAARYLPVTSG